jgi:hypothetical protein
MHLVICGDPRHQAEETFGGVGATGFQQLLEEATAAGPKELDYSKKSAAPPNLLCSVASRLRQ